MYLSVELSVGKLSVGWIVRGWTFRWVNCQWAYYPVTQGSTLSNVWWNCSYGKCFFFLKKFKFFKKYLKFLINLKKTLRGMGEKKISSSCTQSKIVRSRYNGTVLSAKKLQVLNTKKRRFLEEYHEFRNKSKSIARY